MTQPLRALIIEDSEDDAQLVLRALRHGGYEVTSIRVETPDAMQTALRAQAWDVILSDNSLPHFSGSAALALLRALGLDIPFLLVSGKIGEVQAVEMMHAGASDYILKDNLARLVPAVERELHEAGERLERRRAEQSEKLLMAERNALLTRLRLQIERIPLAYLLFDAECRLTDWNPAAQRIFGYSKEEVLGMAPPFERLVPPAFRRQMDELFRRFRSGDMQAHSINENLTRDGRIITCEWLNTPLMAEDGRFDGLLCLAQDLTGRKTLEAQYRQAQKMEALGQLAGGVAHDFNNLLTIINGYSGMLLSKMGPEDSSRDLVEEIHKAGERATLLSRQLLIFCRKQRVIPRLLDLNTVISDVEKMLRRIIGADIRLVSELSARLRTIKADPGYMEQILFNLVVNARDAMPQGGQITIKTRNMTFENGYTRPLTDIPLGSFVMLEVSDTGCGMTPEVQAHLFEPFFTTKEEGKGTGLGLATVFGIIKESGGWIGVESQPGAGTSFRIYLPEAADPKEETNGTTCCDRPPAGNEVVLLVEDEDAVRKLITHILVRCGHTVLEAKNGEQALRLAGQYTLPIPILVTDMVMPGMGGYQLAEQLRLIHPETHVLYLSGYPGHRTTSENAPTTAINFLEKPVSPLALACRVRDILDSDRPGGPENEKAQENERISAGKSQPPQLPKPGVSHPPEVIENNPQSLRRVQDSPRNTRI